MELKIYGDNELRKKALVVTEINQELRKLVLNMFEIMVKKDGVGLAATQLGVNKRLIVIDYKPDQVKVSNPISHGEAYLIPQMPLVLINPEILGASKETIIYEEGCLSVPKIYADVERAKSVILKAKMINGEDLNIECSGFLSIVIQHEVDHLNGILFVDRLTPDNLAKIKKKLDKLKR